MRRRTMRGKTSRNASPDVAGEGEIRRRVAGEMVVEEDAAGAARLVAVRQEEVAVAPRLERPDSRPGRAGRRRRWNAAWKSAASASASGASSRIGVRSPPPPNQPLVVTSMRVLKCAAGTRGLLHVRDQADAAGPEARILRRAGDLRAELRAELAPHGGDVDADLLEHPPAHHAHHAAAAVARRPRSAAPGGALEAAGRAIGQGIVASSSIASNAAHSRSRSASNQARARRAALHAARHAGRQVATSGLFHRQVAVRRSVLQRRSALDAARLVFGRATQVGRVSPCGASAAGRDRGKMADRAAAPPMVRRGTKRDS